METSSAQEAHRQLSTARRAKGMTQSALAQQVGCKQSAISMMEQGRESALAQKHITAIAKILEVDMGSLSIEDHASHTQQGQRYCPTFDCPSNTVYAVNGTLYAMPRESAHNGSSDSKHCSYCGELLEAQCPECRASATPGACCTQCGTAYIATPDALPDGADTWAQSQRKRLQELGII